MIAHSGRSAGSLALVLALVAGVLVAPPSLLDKAMAAPIWELAFVNGHGPRVAESGLTLITNHAYSAPYEDLKLKGR